MTKRKRRAAPSVPRRDDGGILAVSYLGLRKGIGVIGVVLPFMLAIGKVVRGAPGLQNSISAYYYSGMRDVFVGSLVAIGVFLMSCRGYERKDHIAGLIAGGAAVAVALFPTADQDPTPGAKLIGGLHLGFAALFFGMLAFTSLYLFTKTDPKKPPTRRKRQRNVVYKVCGYIIVAVLALSVLLALLPADTIDRDLHPLFWLESIAVVAFGVSWLTKGEAMLKDE